MLRAIVAVAIGLSSTQAHALPAAQRLPVSIRLVGDDALSMRFSEAIKQAVERDDLVRLASYSEKPSLSIESDGNVDWDKLSGQTVVIYTVFLAPRKGEPITGICWERDLAKCSRDIIRLVRIRARNDFLGWYPKQR